MAKAKVQEKQETATLFEAPRLPPRLPAVAGNARRKAPDIAPMPAKAPEPAVPQSVAMLRMIADLARDPSIPVERMETIYRMQKEIRADEARQAFTRAKIAMSEHLPVIDENGMLDVKPKDNQKKGYKRRHARMIDVNDAIKPLLRKYGFDLWFEPGVEADGKIAVVAHLDHEEGFGVTGRVPLTVDISGGKNAQQGVGSSHSYGRRYGTVMILNLDSRAPQDADDDAVASGKLKNEQDNRDRTEEVTFLNEKQTGELQALIKDAGIPEESFCTKYEIDKIDRLPSNLFAEARAAIVDFKRRREGK